MAYSLEEYARFAWFGLRAEFNRRVVGFLKLSGHHRAMGVLNRAIA
jgi:hypothetical protein